jgi:hypothetical protein
LRQFAKIVAGASLMGRHGPREFANRTAYRLSETLAEKWLGVSTGGHLTKAALGIVDPDAHEYSTIPYRAIYRLLRSLDHDWRSSAFVDFGAGKGRAVIAAATFPFSSVTGVELSAALTETAAENIRRMRRRRAVSVNMVTIDAAKFEVPPDANVFYFYNPFAGRLLERVVENIHRSFQERPRRLSILYVNDDHFEPIVTTRHPWLHRTRQLQFYPRLKCGIYRSRD